MTALAPEALAFGPDCEATAMFHYEVALDLEAEGRGFKDNAGRWMSDAAYEDAIAACNAEATLETAQAWTQEFAESENPCETTWVEYAPGGFAAVCGDSDGNELHRVVGSL